MHERSAAVGHRDHGSDLDLWFVGEPWAPAEGSAVHHLGCSMGLLWFDLGTFAAAIVWSFFA
jgi:hypothetical protein